MPKRMKPIATYLTYETGCKVENTMIHMIVEKFIFSFSIYDMSSAEHITQKKHNFQHCNAEYLTQKKHNFQHCNRERYSLEDHRTFVSYSYVCFHLL